MSITARDLHNLWIDGSGNGHGSCDGDGHGSCDGDSMACVGVLWCRMVLHGAVRCCLVLYVCLATAVLRTDILHVYGFDSIGILL